METEAIKRLRRKLSNLRKTDLRRAAEVAYVLAQLLLKSGNQKEAIYFGRECISLFDRCKMETEEDCAARYTVLEGVALPDFIHQEVVKNRLALAGLEL